MRPENLVRFFKGSPQKLRNTLFLNHVPDVRLLAPSNGDDEDEVSTFATTPYYARLDAYSTGKIRGFHRSARSIQPYPSIDTEIPFRLFCAPVLG